MPKEQPYQPASEKVALAQKKHAAQRHKTVRLPFLVSRYDPAHEKARLVHQIRGGNGERLERRWNVTTRSCLRRLAFRRHQTCVDFLVNFFVERFGVTIRERYGDRP